MHTTSNWCTTLVIFLYRCDCRLFIRYWNFSLLGELTLVLNVFIISFPVLRRFYFQPFDMCVAILIFEHCWKLMASHRCNCTSALYGTANIFILTALSIVWTLTKVVTFLLNNMEHYYVYLVARNLCYIIGNDWFCLISK